MANEVIDLVDSDSDEGVRVDGSNQQRQQQRQGTGTVSRKRRRNTHTQHRAQDGLAVDGVARLPMNQNADISGFNNHDVIVIDEHETYGRNNTSSSAPKSTNRKRKAIPQNSHSTDDIVVLSDEDSNRNDGHLKPRASAAVAESLTPKQRVLEVFPDIDMSHCETLLEQAGVARAFHNHPSTLTHEAMIQSVLLQLAEGPSYPKSKDGGAGAHHPHDALIKRLNGTSQTDYMSPSSFTPTSHYIEQAIMTLMADFPFLSKECIKRHLAGECQQHYAIFHNNVCNAVMGKSAVPAENEGKEEKQYNALVGALAGQGLSFRQTARVKKLQGVTGVLKRPRKSAKASTPVTDPILKDEIAYVKHKHHTYMEEASAKIQRARARKISEMTGSTMECQCCFADVAMEEMISCKTEGHLFCVDCIRRFAEEQVFGQGNLGMDKSTNSPALELKCMYGEGCTSGFDQQFLRKALPEKVLTKYDELCFQAAVDKAGIEDLCTCPKCGYQAVLPSTQMIFACPVQDCLYESCRKCGEEPHIPLRCDEVEKKNETKGRLKVEEAISAAKIRTCPKPGCGKKFVKSDGCNKMTCSCRTLICYICRQEIPRNVGYAHFCQQPHCNHKKCKKCKLYSNAEEDDALAMREAGVKAAEEVRKQSLMPETGSLGHSISRDQVEDNGIQINVDSILENPTGANSGSRRADATIGPPHRFPVPPVGLPPIHGMVAMPPPPRRRRR